MYDANDRFFDRLRASVDRHGRVTREHERVIDTMQTLKMARESLDAIAGALPPPTLVSALLRWVGLKSLVPVRARDPMVAAILRIAESDFAEAVKEYDRARAAFLTGEREIVARDEAEAKVNRTVMDNSFPTDPDVAIVLPR